MVITITVPVPPEVIPVFICVFIMALSIIRAAVRDIQD